MRALALGLLLGAACIPRVSLPVLPAPGAPLEEREAAYRALAPVDQPEPVTSKTTSAVYSHKPYPFLSLGNGLEIFDPRDLATAVGPASPTAAAITRYDDRRYYGGITLLAGGGLMLVGCALATTGVITQRGRFDGVAWSGIGAMLAGFATAVVGAFVNLSSFGALREAFDGYRADLAAALELPAR